MSQGYTIESSRSTLTVSKMKFHLSLRSPRRSPRPKVDGSNYAADLFTFVAQIRKHSRLDRRLSRSENV